MSKSQEKVAVITGGTTGMGFTTRRCLSTIPMGPWGNLMKSQKQRYFSPQMTLVLSQVSNCSSMGRAQI